MQQIEVWVHRDGRNTVAQAVLLVVQAKEELPVAMEYEILARMNGGGEPGNYIFTDRIGRRDDGTYLHFLHGCRHESDEAAIQESLAWVKRLAADYDIAIMDNSLAEAAGSL